MGAAIHHRRVFCCRPGHVRVINSMFANFAKSAIVYLTRDRRRRVLHSRCSSVMGAENEVLELFELARKYPAFPAVQGQLGGL